jgi:hypothetical protein
MKVVHFNSTLYLKNQKLFTFLYFLNIHCIKYILSYMLFVGFNENYILCNAPTSCTIRLFYKIMKLDLKFKERYRLLWGESEHISDGNFCC